jgi:hypothetical protein
LRLRGEKTASQASSRLSPQRGALAACLPLSAGWVHSATGETVDTVVRRFISTVEDRSISGLDLLRQLRVDLADLCAVGVHCEFGGAVAPGGYPRLDFDTEAFAETEFQTLATRIPPEIYRWSALLPLTWESVGDVGVRRLAGDLSEAVAHARYASLIWDASDDALRRSAWDTEFGISSLPRVLFVPWRSFTRS